MTLPPRLRQLPLALRLAPNATFANFTTTEATAPVLHALQHWLRSPAGGTFYLAGPSGSGRTHLLQAAAQRCDGWYLPLGLVRDQSPVAVLEGLESAVLLCLDDIDRVVFDPAWAEALFGLFNRLRDSGGHLLVSAAVAPAGLVCPLPDLTSRLAWDGSYRLTPLDDEGRRRLLEARAAERGLRLSPEVISWLIVRFSRESQQLVSMVEKLDDISLVTKQRITIPLVRELLAADR